MKSFLLRVRNAVIAFLYRVFLKPIFFRRDPEDIHDGMTKVGLWLGKWRVMRGLTRMAFAYSNPVLHQRILGIDFVNPIGLSAGFDKNAQLLDILPEVGFGFVEIGSVTGEPCEGNPKPRLWRLKKSKALVVYYGLKNDGCEAISKRLAGRNFRIPVGVSVAKTNCAETCELKAGVADYVKAFRHFVDIGNYITVNISCPNAFGGQPFTDPISLEMLLNEIDKIPYGKPIFIKLSPDLSFGEIDKLLVVAGRHRVNGFICTNLTKKRDGLKIFDENVPEHGGISGKVVAEMATAMISHVYRKVRRKYVIIGSGGVFTADDAYVKIKAGASLLQLITGMIFRGPQVVSEINEGLCRLLAKDGFKNVGEAVGKL